MRFVCRMTSPANHSKLQLVELSEQNHMTQQTNMLGWPGSQSCDPLPPAMPSGESSLQICH